MRLVFNHVEGVHAFSVFNPNLSVPIVYSLLVDDALGMRLELTDTVCDIARNFLAGIDLNVLNPLYHAAFVNTIANLTPSAFNNTRGSHLTVSMLLGAWSRHLNPKVKYPIGTFGAQFSKAMSGLKV